MSWLDRILFRGKKRPGQWRPVPESKGEVAVGDGAVLNVSSNSYRTLIEAAVSDAERIAADIREKARSDANAEATRVLAQANLEAEQLKAKAEVIAREEALNIISEAIQTADGIEIEAKKRAVQFLVQQSQLIEKEIAREYRLALAKLSANLQSLSSDSDKINLQLKRKMAMLAANKSLALNEAKTALLGTAEGAASPFETPPGITNKSASGIDTKADRAGLSVKKEHKHSRKRPALPVEIQPEPVLPAHAVDFKLEKAVSAATAEPAGVDVKEPALVAAAPEAVKQKTSDPPYATGPAAPGAVIQPEAELPTLLDVDTQTQYSGEVELMVVPPVDLKLVTQLYNFLQTIPELKVLYTRGSWDQGTTIVVVLEKPFPLIKAITAIPNVSVSIGVLEKDAAAGGKTISLLRRKDRAAKRLGLILKEAVAAPRP